MEEDNKESGVISIHALLTESDGPMPPMLCCPTNFNPRSPHGERPWRGVRRRRGFRISIHALLTESDGSDAADALLSDEFQSTLSSRRATRLIGSMTIHLMEFQSTLSSRRATPSRPLTIDDLNKFQSTLSSRRATCLTSCILRLLHDFNPRSPHGERRWFAARSTSLMVFQSTLSSRRATTPPSALVVAAGRFQSTLSSRRATGARPG